MRIDRFRPVSTAERQIAVLRLALAFLNVARRHAVLLENQRKEKILV